MKASAIMFGLLLVAACRTTRQADRENAESTIRARFVAGQAAWNRGDIAYYLDGYWDSEKTRWASGGTVLRGKDAITAAFKARFPTRQQMWRSTS